MGVRTGTGNWASSSGGCRRRRVAMSDRIYSAEQIVVPPELPHLLKAFTKEVIRHHPPDIVSFSREYVPVMWCTTVRKA